MGETTLDDWKNFRVKFFRAKGVPNDNQNVVVWLNKRYSEVPAVQALLRLLGLVEARLGFSVVRTYI